MVLTLDGCRFRTVELLPAKLTKPCTDAVTREHGGQICKIAPLAIAKELWDVSPINLAEGKVASPTPAPSPECDGHELKLH